VGLEFIPFAEASLHKKKEAQYVPYIPRSCGFYPSLSGMKVAQRYKGTVSGTN
jgi:hypothetical protein